jgi:hypothetical protein
MPNALSPLPSQILNPKAAIRNPKLPNCLLLAARCLLLAACWLHFSLASFKLLGYKCLVRGGQLWLESQLKIVLKRLTIVSCWFILVPSALFSFAKEHPSW